MDEAKLPTKRPTGVQLGLGLGGPRLYTLLGSEEDKNWLSYIDDDLPEGFSDFRIVSARTLIDKNWNPVPLSGDRKKITRKNLSEHMVYDEFDLSDTSDWNEEDEFEPVNDDEIISKHVKTKDLKFPRAQWNKAGLSLLSPQLRVFKDVRNRGRNAMYQSTITQLSSFHFDTIPGGTLTTNLSEQAGANSKLSQSNKRYTVVVNPTVTDTITIGRVQLDLDQGKDELNYRQVFVYSSGKTNSKLNISLISRRKSGPFPFPILKRVHTIDLHTPIKSIKLPVFSGDQTRPGNFLGVITDTALHIIKIKHVDQPSKMTLVQLDPLNFTELGDFPFADFAFNPWNTNEIAVIDTKGNWAIGEIPLYSTSGAKIELVRELRGSVYDIESPSMQNSILWSTQPTRLLTSDKSRIIELDFANNWQSEIAQAKTWSDILDMRKVTDDITMVLTTREIIVLTTRYEAGMVQREVSWKHDLDPTDKTYKFSIETISFSQKDLFLVFVFSKKHNNIYMHTFTSSSGSESAIIRSADMSTIISVPGTFRGIQSVALFDEIKKKSEDEDLSDLTLSLCVRGWKDNKVINLILSNASGRAKSNSNTDTLISEELHDDWEVLRNIAPKNLSHIPPAVESLVDDVVNSLRKKRITASTSNNDDEHLGEFGYNLSEGLNEFLRNSKSIDGNKNDSGINNSLQPLLLELAKPPEHFEDLNEFSSLLHQFYDHYKDQGILFTNLLNIFQLFTHDEVGSIDIFYNKLLQCWDLVCDDADAEFLTKEVIKFIIWSSHRFTEIDKYSELEDKLQENLSPEYRELIDNWEAQEDDVDNLRQSLLGTIPRSSQPQFSFGSQSQIPEIKSSQNLKKVYKKRPVVSSSQRLFSSQVSLPVTMSPAFSLMGSSSQLSRPSSQLEVGGGFKLSSSQPTKRKKRKVRGFN